MNFLPKVSFNGAEDKGAELKKSVVEYCDKSDNGIFELQTSDEFIKENEQNSQTTDTFENLSFKHGEEYYSSGTVPVAVIGTFKGESGVKGLQVCNTIKSVNPDVSITKIDAGFSGKPEKTSADSFINDHPLVDNFIYENKLLRNISGVILSETQSDSVEKCLDELIKQQDSGAEFKAVNLSCECECSYPEINRLVIQETNEEITPENIYDYKSDIKQVLEGKRDRRILAQAGKQKISQLLNIIEKTEELNVPVYMTGSAQVGDEKVFNLFALADNAVCYDRETADSFSSSAALAKDMEKYGFPKNTDYIA